MILENIDIDKAVLQNIDINKISNRFKFGISNRAILASVAFHLLLGGLLGHLLSKVATQTLYLYKYSWGHLVVPYTEELIFRPFLDENSI